MNPLEMVQIMEMIETATQSAEPQEQWLVYVSEKGENSCKACLQNHGKKFKESDLSRPALPIHPNCLCQYERLDLQKTKLKSATVRVEGAPGLGGIKINSTDDMLDKLEKQYAAGTLSELVIVNHGEFAGEFELGSRGSRLDLMTSEQMKRLKKLLAPDAIIDIRMCYGISEQHGEQVAQDLANKLGCKIKAYANQVSPFGTRPAFSKEYSVPFWKRPFIGTGAKIFSPEK